jgi:hypothetical protein
MNGQLLFLNVDKGPGLRSLKESCLPENVTGYCPILAAQFCVSIYKNESEKAPYNNLYSEQRSIRVAKGYISVSEPALSAANANMLNE